MDINFMGIKNDFAGKKITNLILDIDNVICDSKALHKYIPTTCSRKGWDEYNKHYDLIVPNTSMPYIIWAFIDVGLKHIDFITSREDYGDIREITLKHIEEAFNNPWIDSHIFLEGLEFNLFMRNYCDYRPSWQVKQDILQQKIIPYRFVDLAIDDSQENVEMFQRNGVKAVLYDKYCTDLTQ